MISKRSAILIITGTIVTAAVVGLAAIWLSGPSAADREIDQLITGNRDAVLNKLRQISASAEQAQKEMLEQFQARYQSNRPLDQINAEVAQRFSELSPRPNFDLAGPDGNAVVLPNSALEEVKLALAGRYDDLPGRWPGPRGQIGVAIPMVAKLAAISPRPKKKRNGDRLEIRPEELQQWISLLMKVRYVLSHQKRMTDAAIQSSGDSFSGGYTIVDVWLFDVENRHCVGLYDILSRSSLDISVSIPAGDEYENRKRVESALANDLSANSSDDFSVEFKKFFPWE